tara:strand:- start:1629 stop:2279 length:651 start_codon:yes stop_codon:yes gene_type:complete
MSSKPKRQDYKASEAEKASAAVAKAEYEFFKANYEPLLIKMRDKVKDENYRDSIRGRASADVAQALTGNLSLQQVTNVASAGDTAAAYSGQLQKADDLAKSVKNKMATGVLGTARGQAAEAQSGLAQVSRMETATALQRAKENQALAQAKFTAGVQIGGALGMQGLSNMQQGRSFFGGTELGQPLPPGVQGPPAPDRKLGFRDRLQAGSFGNLIGG